MILKQHRNIEFVFLHLFWITTMFQTNTLFKTNKCHHGGPPWSGGPGAIAPVAPPLNPALRSSEMPFCVMFCTYRRHPSRFLTDSWHIPRWWCRMPFATFLQHIACPTVCCGHWSWQQKIASVWPISMMPCFEHPTQLIAAKVSITLSTQLFCSANTPLSGNCW